MIRNWTMLGLAACAIVAGAERVAYAQPKVLAAYTCAFWTPVASDKKGTRRLVYPIFFARPGQLIQLDGEYSDGRFVFKGYFIFESTTLVGLLSQPDRDDPTFQFTTPVGHPIRFLQDGTNVKMVQSGEIVASLRDVLVENAAECAKGDSATKLVEVEKKSLKDIASVDDAKSGADPAAGKPSGDPGAAKPVDVGGPPGGKPGGGRIAMGKPPFDGPGGPGGLSKLADEANNRPDFKPEPVPARPSLKDLGAEPGKTPGAEPPKSADKPTAPSLRPSLKDIGKRAEGPDAGDADPEKTPSVESAKPGPKVIEVEPKPVAPKIVAAVCDTDDFQAVTFQPGAAPASLQMVGLRNKKADVAGADYDSVVGEGFPLEGTVTLADSAGILVPYEAVALKRGGGPESLWVSLTGVDEKRIKRKDAPPAKPDVILRVIVVGGAQEVAVSGLDQIGAELRKQAGSRVGISAEWYVVDETGAMKSAGPPFNSLDRLVKAAAGKAGGRSDVLTETQLNTLFDGFDNLMASQTKPADKVFWVKGSYAIPSSFPARFEKFLNTVSASNAVAHDKSGAPAKWFAIISGRMPGFSIAYLKEPVYGLQIGDVYEGGEAITGTRPLIDNSVLPTLVLKLRMASAAAATVSADSPPNPLNGKLVLDAKDVFEDRGYLLSVEAVTALKEHLARVSELWTKPEALDGYAAKLRKSSPALIDILQIAEEGGYPRLPRTMGDWSRKPVKELNPAEKSQAQAFVRTYAGAVGKLADAIAKDAAKAAGCGLLYVSEAELLGRS